MFTAIPSAKAQRAASQPACARGREPARLPAGLGQEQARVACVPVSPTATTTTVVLERRFNGPPGTANGGYACGIVARHVDGPAHVSLRRPVPARPRARARAPRRRPRHPPRRGDADRRGRPRAAARRPRAAAPAERSRRRARPPPRAPPPGRRRSTTCWVCSHRAPTGSAWCSARWRARPELTGAVLTRAGDGGELAPEIVWAALDCPSYTPTLWGTSSRACSPPCTRSCSRPCRPASRSRRGLEPRRRGPQAPQRDRDPRSRRRACSRVPRRSGSVCVAEFTIGSHCTCLRP